MERSRARSPAVTTDDDDDAVDLKFRAHGSCQGVELGIFYPSPDDRWAVSRAKAICSTCPVQEQCREHAMTSREPAGVWGGTDEWERRRVWRREGRRLRY
ncbi:MAG: WhiB family transcriptional regulator [Acidimicrobiales bacterium]